MNISIRHATQMDEPAIRALVRNERLNPTGPNWDKFLVAVSESKVIGAVQMRKHSDGTRELGSLVVDQSSRGQGIAARMVDAVLAPEQGAVWMITDNAFANRHAKWGFRRAGLSAAPRSVLFNYVMGRLGVIVTLIKRRPLRRLVNHGAPLKP